MDKIIAALQGALEPGLYQLTETSDRESLSAFCEAKDFQLFEINGAAITNKADFLKTCAEIMHFPDYFGHNWDAFEDCIKDLDWLPASGYVLLYRQPENFAKTAASDWSTLINILQSTVKDWRELRTPMYVFFQISSSHLPDLKEL